MEFTNDQGTAMIIVGGILVGVVFLVTAVTFYNLVDLVVRKKERENKS